MEQWTLIEILAQLNAAELRRKSREPSPPPAPPGGLRRRLAQGLIGLGLRLDADASRAVIGPTKTTPRLNGSDA